MNDDDAKAIAAAMVEMLMPRIERALRSGAKRVIAARQKAQPGYMTGKLARFVGNATQYAKDWRYGKICEQGLMPHSKLLKLAKVPAHEFRAMVDAAIAAGQIEACCDPVSGLMCYRLRNQQTAPQPDLAALDDPEQDSHTWNFAKALERARLEREM